MVRDIIASIAKSAGALVHVEPRTGHGIVQDLDELPRVLDARAVHTADVVATLPDGRSLTLDIRGTNRPPQHGLRAWMTQTEAKKS